MFENLTNKFEEIFSSLKKAPSLNEKQVEEGLRNIRQALLEADVALPVAKALIDNIKPKAIGQEIIRSTTPGQMIVKVVYDEIVKILGDTKSELNFNDVWKNKLTTDVKSFGPDLIGITCMFTMTHKSFKSVCNYAADFSIPIAIGGVHVSNDSKRIMADIPSADIAFLKEGELTFTNFVKVINGDDHLSHLIQIIIRDGKKRYKNATNLL